MSKETVVGWRVDDYSLQDPLEYLKKEQVDERLLSSAALDLLNKAVFLFWCYYIVGQNEISRDIAETSVEKSADYFFGDWKSKAKVGNAKDLPPDPEYWHQALGNQVNAAIEAMSTASVISDWASIARVAEYVATIRWQEVEMMPGTRWIDVKDGEGETGLHLAIAWLLHGKEPIPQRFYDMVNRKSTRREKALMAVVRALETGDAVPQTFDAYFKVQCKLSSKPPMAITKALLIEGTLLINFAMHKGYTIEVPECIGPRYIQLDV